MRMRRLGRLKELFSCLILGQQTEPKARGPNNHVLQMQMLNIHIQILI